MGPSQISDTPCQGYCFFPTLISDVSCELSIWAHQGTCFSESVLLDIHGVVRREGNPRKRKPSPGEKVCFTSSLHILAVHVQYQLRQFFENHEVNFTGALAAPKRYPRDTFFSAPDTQMHVSL